MTEAEKKTRGHWPVGKRRNPVGKTWNKVRLTLQSLVDEHYEPGVRSKAAAALAMGVSDRTVRRWLDGTDVPSEELQMVCRQWCAEQVAEIKSERRGR